MATGKKEDPMEKIGRLIDERLENAFSSREQKAKESTDPWARLEGIIDRKISEHFDAFTKAALGGDGEPAGGGKGKDEGGEGGDDFITQLFGGGRR